MSKDDVMVSEKSAGVMGLVMKENGFITFVMATGFIKQVISKSIEVSGSMICDTVKENGPNQMAALFMEILEMIDATVCVLINKQQKRILSLLSTRMA